MHNAKVTLSVTPGGNNTSWRDQFTPAVKRVGADTASDVGVEQTPASVLYDWERITWYYVFLQLGSFVAPAEQQTPCSSLHFCILKW